jgi:hypothetical protein
MFTVIKGENLMELEEKIEQIKQLFAKAREGNNYQRDFDIIVGGNGILLRPNKKHLLISEFCIKFPIDESTYPLVLKDKMEKINEEELIEEQLETIKEVYSVDNFKNRSINGDLKNYFDIIKYPELKQFVPKFYYPDFNNSEWENADFIIMDYIEGDSYRLETLPDCYSKNDHHKSEIEKLYCLFKRHFFDSEDNFEYIEEKNSGRIVLIDLDGINKK